MGLPVPGERQSRPDSGRPFESATRYQRSQSVSSQSDDGAAGPRQDDAKCVRCVPSRGARFEARWRVAEAGGNAQQQVLKQLTRARSPKNQPAVAADAGIEQILRRQTL